MNTQTQSGATLSASTMHVDDIAPLVTGVLLPRARRIGPVLTAVAVIVMALVVLAHLEQSGFTWNVGRAPLHTGLLAVWCLALRLIAGRSHSIALWVALATFNASLFAMATGTLLFGIPLVVLFVIALAVTILGLKADLQARSLAAALGTTIAHLESIDDSDAL